MSELATNLAIWDKLTSLVTVDSLITRGQQSERPPQPGLEEQSGHEGDN